MAKYGYIRVSTKEQNEARQIEALKKQGLKKLNMLIDKATGKNFDRPQYRHLKENIEKEDELFIISVDRLGRNKEQCLKELKELKDKGVMVRVLDIPTTLIKVDEKNSSMIDMINNILIEVYTTLAQEELRKITTRQREGIDAMKIDPATGKKIGKSGKATGRPKLVLTSIQENCIKAWLDKSNKAYKLADCIKDTGLGRATLYRIKAEKKEMI